MSVYKMGLAASPSLRHKENDDRGVKAANDQLSELPEAMDPIGQPGKVWLLSWLLGAAPGLRQMGRDGREWWIR